MRAWLICPMISSKCAALFPESLIITIYNLHKEIWYCKIATQNLSKQKDRRKVRSPVISTQLLWSTDISRIFFTNENPRKFVEKQKMIFFYIFHVYLDNSKRTITQGTSAPEDFLPRGNFGQKIFPQEAFVQERPSLPRRPFFSKKMSTSLEPLCNKEHPMAKYVVWSKSADKTEIRHLVIVLREIMTLQTKSSYGIFCS